MSITISQIQRIVKAYEAFKLSPSGESNDAILRVVRQHDPRITVNEAHGFAEGVTATYGAMTKLQPELQDGVAPWMQECFGPEIASDKIERGDRLIEEVFELLQSGDYPRERIRALEDYVYNRPVGEPAQEVGGVMITLAAYCLAHGLNMHEAGRIELERITQPEIVKKIRAKQAAKPTGSALPIKMDDEPLKCPEEYKGPYFVYDFMPQKVMFKSPMGDSQALDVLNVRGWGMLTGHGEYAYGLPQEVAALKQDTFGKWVAKTLNEAITKETNK